VSNTAAYPFSRIGHTCPLISLTKGQCPGLSKHEEKHQWPDLPIHDKQNNELLLDLYHFHKYIGKLTLLRCSSSE